MSRYRIALIDNYDSYTWNLYQLIWKVAGDQPVVLRNDEVSADEVLGGGYTHVVISPGPGHPSVAADFGICADILRRAEIPCLGVCLGHQGLAAVSGGTVQRAPEVVHGRTSTVLHDGTGVFAGLPQGFRAVRYHSLAVAEPVPDPLRVTARTADGVIMGLEHRDRPVHGVQFHPESIESEQGEQLIANFLGMRDAGSVAVPAAPAATSPAAAVRWQELDEDLSAEALFTVAFADQPYAFWLDSSRQAYGMGRYSYLGAAATDGVRVLRAFAERGEVEVEAEDGVHRLPGDLFTRLREELATQPVVRGAGPVPFTGGFVGYLGYGLRGSVGIGRGEDRAEPDAELIRVDRFVAIDHVAERRYLVTVGLSEEQSDSWFAEMSHQAQRASRWPVGMLPQRSGGLQDLSASVDRATYLRHFDEVQRWLRSGDSYEACYTYQVTARCSEDPYSTYRRLRRLNPAPYAAFLRLGDRRVLSSSPERFVTVTADGWAEAKPIKGTAARDPDPARDAQVRADLPRDDKIRSENLMITDLLRNDLGRLCEVGTVGVPHLMAVESYATVHQVVTTVRGRLRPEIDGVGCVAGLFPAGSMTGAPKKRTVELLDALEPVERGVYSGSLGFFGYDGQTDQSVVIRTIVWDGDRVTAGAGGALTVMSDAEEEYAETRLKLQALLQSLDAGALTIGAVEVGR